MIEAEQSESPAYDSRPEDGRLVITFTGPKIPFEVGGSLYRVVEVEGHRRLILNFAKVRVISSSQIGILIQLKKKADALGGSVRLCAIDADLMEILRLTHTSRLFEIFNDEVAALDAPEKA